MRRIAIIALFALTSLSSTYAAEKGDKTRGRRDFGACAPCHSLEPNRNMAGPSLANLWGRKAGTLSSFDRFSDPLKVSGVVWGDRRTMAAD
jgi:cytochrome c